MATLLRSESRQMYSWWWDSHISPKNSKWLQENLTDMDVKIKSMIKLIEEDADSFARKAEMYYKKRPELMNLVEEFYRAYRALAERYDHATKVIRDAHSTSSEALPEQVPFSDDYSSPSAQADPGPPKLLNLNGDFTNELDSVTRRKTVKLFDDPLGPVECVRRGLNFDECEDKLKGELSNCNTNAEHRKLSTSNQEVKEIVVLKEALATLEAEKEAGIVQYQHCLDKLSNLQSEMSKTREDFREQKDYGSKTEDNFVVPEEALTGLYQENESKNLDYKQGVDGLWNLQTLLPTGQQAQKHVEGVYADEIEAHQEVNKSAVERKDCLSNPVQLQETISNLENKLLLIEDDASRLKERAETAESEVEILKQLVLKLTGEKEAAATQHQRSLMTLSSLENKFTCALNKVKGLNVEISKGVSQMKSAEEKCLLLESMNRSLSSEMESLMLKMRNQTKELTEKQKKHEGRCISMEEEKESTRHEVKELQALLELEKQEHASYVQNSEIRFSGIDTEMKLLQEQYEWRMRELEQVLDNAIGSEIQLSVLWITAHQMKESNCSLSVENQRLKDESMLSTNKILKLERKILEQQVEIESLLNQNTSLKAGTCQLMKALNIEDSVHEVEADEPYQEYANRLLSEILNMKKSLVEGVEENIENIVELPVHSMRIQQLGMDLQNLDLEKTNIGQELKVKTEQDLALQNEAFTLTHVHEELRSKSIAGDGKNEAVETLNEKLSLKARLHELHDKLNKQNIQEEILQFELQKNQEEIDVMGTASASISSRLHYSVVNQLLYKQKALELHALCIYHMDQTKHLKTQLAAFGPELLSLKECISSLENHMDVHIKFQDPENDKSQDAQPENSSLEDIVINDKKAFMPNTFSDLRNLRVRLQAIIKAAVEMKEQQVQENANIRSKLDASMRQLELLQSQSQRHWRSIRSIPEITEADGALSMKDIVLDQISDSSSHCFSNGEPVGMDSQTIELWETGSTDGKIGLTFHKPKRIVSPSSPDNTVLIHNKLMKKQNSDIPNSGSMVQQEPKVDKLGISKRSYDSVQEENNRKFLQRLKSDVQTLTSLQNTVQDLKRKLEATSKNRRGKEVIQCGSFKEQLEEADVTVAKLFGLHDILMKSIGDCSSSSDTNSSFNLEEEDGNGKRIKMAHQAQKMAESIARLEVEVQKLQYSLQKLNNNNDKGGITKIIKTRQRTLLKDYLYGSHRRKKSPFCACMQPSTDEL